MSIVILAVGLVLTLEGLVFALAPQRLEEVLEQLKNMTPEGRRAIGLAGLAVGVFLIWLAKTMGI
ncbi:MAG: DUF2065 domain-containing protein [Paracoccaceae bacterium]